MTAYQFLSLFFELDSLHFCYLQFVSPSSSSPHLIASKFKTVKMESAKNFYNRQYVSWVPWAEDKYLAWWGQNKTSYVAKGASVSACIRLLRISRCSLAIFSTSLTLLAGEMDKTKITGDKNVDAIQDGVNQGVTGQFSKGGALEGVGNLTSKEVFTRSERQGKNDKGQTGL